jgi:Transglycosylase SLT domain
LIAAFWEPVMRYGFARTQPRVGDLHALSEALLPGGFDQVCDFVLILLLSTTMAVIGPPALASGVGADATAAQRQPSARDRQPEENHDAEQNHEPEPSAPSTARNPCEALAAAATANDLPVDFFSRLIWQESHFKPHAISRKGALGIAQFMPTTARSSGLENPFNSLEAIAKSGELLRDLRREFGNLGLAAAAYNAGSGRVHDWLGGRRPLPQETRAYVRFVTGRSVEEWTGGQTTLVEMPSVEVARCNLPATTLIESEPDASTPRPETIKPWGVEVVGAPTPAKALARYREWQSKYAAIVADREAHVVIRGIIGAIGAARVRVGENDQVAAKRLCAALKAAGTYCDVLRN